MSGSVFMLHPIAWPVFLSSLDKCEELTPKTGVRGVQVSHLDSYGWNPRVVPLSYPTILLATIGHSSPFLFYLTAIDTSHCGVQLRS